MRSSARAAASRAPPTRRQDRGRGQRAVRADGHYLQLSAPGWCAAAAPPVLARHRQLADSRCRRWTTHAARAAREGFVFPPPDATTARTRARWPRHGCRSFRHDGAHRRDDRRPPPGGRRLSLPVDAHAPRRLFLSHGETASCSVRSRPPAGHACISRARTSLRRWLDEALGAMHGRDRKSLGEVDGVCRTPEAIALEASALEARQRRGCRWCAGSAPLERPGADRIIVVISLALLAFSLDTGLSADDYVHKLIAQRRAALPAFIREPLDLFRFTNGAQTADADARGRGVVVGRPAKPRWLSSVRCPR